MTGCCANWDMSEHIAVVPYDPRWTAAFEQERAAILHVLEGTDVRVEHMGSTAVPGLAAKPILDLMLVVPDAPAAVRTITPLLTLGYECRGEYGIAGRIYYSKGNPRTHHLHEYWGGNPEIERHLLFRDYLREHVEARDAYSELKRGLAEKYRNDREGYTEAKTEFVRDIEQRAYAERAAKKL